VSRAIDPLRAGARRILGRDLRESEAERSYNYLKLLNKWHRIHRLTGSGDRQWAIVHIVLDSLLFLHVLPDRLTADGARGTVLDLGSGAGVPGVPLAIVCPTLDFVLVESRRRRASFLSEVVRTLPLGNARVVADRAESIEREMVGRVDAVVIRCAGDPATVLPVAKRLVARGGVVVASGPPEPIPVAEGQWVEVEGVESGTRRRFLVVQC
jgi:16S rRNA (guanine527-N7)-methyltransferase